MARKAVRKLASTVTPDQEAKANDAANRILAELDAAKTAQECADISEKHAKVFARLQKVHPVRAIHIVNLASLKKREFEQMQKKKNQAQAELWA